MRASRKTIVWAAATVAFVAGMSGRDIGGLVNGGLLAQAQARVGRPLTPVSYAGVARRTTRRAVAVGAAAGAGVYYGTSCVQVVDAYGRIVTRC
ncbi:hypothetical protein ACVIJ6_003629 [Bradyrhizobium sp. USDA 4369]